MTEFHQIKKHWNEVGGEGYQHFWEGSLAHQDLSKRESEFVRKFIPKKRTKSLDYGTGSGRFLKLLLENTNQNSEIYALDISDEMVKYCQNSFGLNEKVKGIRVINEFQDIYNYYQTSFDFITAIRVLKYSSNWQEILKNLFETLNKEGTLIFTMPNKYSVANLQKPKSPYIRIAIGEIKKIAKKNNIKILEIKGFAKMPDLFYRIENNLFSKIVLFCERILRFLFGNKLFEREIFYVFTEKII